MVRSSERWDPSARRRDRADALEGGGRAERDPQPAVAGEALLGGEVVDVELARGRRAARRPPLVASMTSAIRRRRLRGGGVASAHAGRRLVVGVGVERRCRRRPPASGWVPAGELRSRRDRRGTGRRRRPRRTWPRTRRTTRCWLRCSIRPKVAASQKTVEPPSPSTHLVAVGQVEQLAEPGADVGRRRSGPRPGGGWCRDSSNRWPARSASASGRTLDGPQPKRPSRGSRSAGRRIAGGLEGSPDHPPMGRRGVLPYIRSIGAGCARRRDQVERGRSRRCRCVTIVR